MVMLGAFTEITKLSTVESIEKAIAESLPENTKETNINAFRKGLELV